MALVLGVDSSTQSTKVQVRDIESGKILGSGSASHPATIPPVSEQDPNSWWVALAEAVSQLDPSLRSEVVAMAVASQQHGLVLIDGDNKSVRPAKLWNDTTSAPDAEHLLARLAPEVWANKCGSVPGASFTISKLAWIVRSEPETLNRVDKVMLPHDYLTWRLTGRHVTDRGDASGTGWFDPVANTYRTELLGCVVDDPSAWLDRLPALVDHNSAVGELRSSAAVELGLNKSVLVGVGTGDNMAGAIGLGLKPGDVAMSLGTSGTVYSVSERPVNDPSGLVAGFADANGLYQPLVCTLNATRVTDSVARWLGTDAVGLGELALSAEPGSESPVLIPFFDGERTPNLPHASGEMFGLRTNTSREALALAAHDGVLCGLLNGLDALRSTGAKADGRLNLIGGGARSLAYQQRCADLHGDVINVPLDDELVAAGSAVQAASLVAGQSTCDIGSLWGLGEGRTIEPTSEGSVSGVREAFNARVSQIQQEFVSKGRQS